MQTVKLYETDSSAFSFHAIVLGVVPYQGGYGIVLDKTLFFPEGGGQAGDIGSLSYRDTAFSVRDTRIVSGEILHITDAPIPVGEVVAGELNIALRKRRMQCHSGEHIVSGIVHALFGYENVGFHLGDDDVTLDFNGVLTREELLHVEHLANAAVYADLPIEVSYPSPGELASLAYRSKLELTEGVRIVRIPGIDTCACCAPHVARTGEIGEIKLLDFSHYKGGVRVHMLAGVAAWEDHHARYLAALEISHLLSLKQNEIVGGVSALLARCDTLRGEVGALRRSVVALRAEALSFSVGNRILTADGLDAEALRELVTLAVKKTDGIVIGLLGEDGSGYRYIIGAEASPLRTLVREYNAALSGRGGGRDTMVEGTFRASLAEIRAYFAK